MKYEKTDLGTYRIVQIFDNCAVTVESSESSDFSFFRGDVGSFVELGSTCDSVSEKMWWLSFADATLPKGSQFLGAAIVHGETLIDAVRRAHLLGINPGGEVLGIEIPQDMEIESRWIECLLSRKEWEEFDALYAKKSSSVGE